MDSNLLAFESILEMKAINYLSAVDSNPSSQETRKLVEDIFTDVLDKNLRILMIDATGNVGIALKSILENRLISSPQLQLLTVLIGYYAITNHINNPIHDKHPLLFINRAQLIYSNLDIFHQMYMQVDKPKNPYINNALSPNFAVSMMILSDFYPYRDYSEYTKQSFLLMLDNFKSKINLGVYTDSNMWIHSHQLVFNRVKEIVEALIPTFNNIKF